MNSTDRQRADWSCDNVAKDCFPATLGFPPGRSNDGEGSMPDPMIIVAIVKASGGLLQERDIVGSHRLEKHMWQTHLVAVRGNVGEAFEELEELRRMHDRVRNR